MAGYVMGKSCPHAQVPTRRTVPFTSLRTTTRSTPATFCSQQAESVPGAHLWGAGYTSLTFMTGAIRSFSFNLAALARKSGDVRLIGHLSAERVSPDSGDFQSAFRTTAVRREEILKDSIAIAMYEKMSAAGAIGIYQAAGLPWQIPGVDVMQSCLATDFSGTLQVCSRRSSCSLHLVVGIKSGDVPWNIG